MDYITDKLSNCQNDITPTKIHKGSGKALVIVARGVLQFCRPQNSWDDRCPLTVALPGFGAGGGTKQRENN